jgi:hypothetical protein
VTLSARTLAYVDRYSVDLIFWDQWDFLEPVFRGAGAWTQFDWQHGPHRQGLGGLLLAVLLPATGWSIRAEAFASAMFVIPAAAMAWATLRRATAVPSWTDVVARRCASAQDWRRCTSARAIRRTARYRWP